MASDISTFGKIARDLARNPLGIIALFIVLIYGFAALLLNNTATKLPPDQTYILVLFLALFPVVVLMTFAWLVALHHAKLYAPGDFKTDEAFLQTLSPAERKLFRDREIEAEEQLSAQLPGQAQRVLPPRREGGREEPDFRTAYIRAENLVFQRLEKEFGKSIQREVRVLGTGDLGIFDGALLRDTGMTLIEVKFTRSPFMPSVMLRDVLYRAVLAAQRAKQVGGPSDLRLLLVVVADVSEEDKERLVKRVSGYVRDAPVPVELRVYTTEELEKKEE